MQAPVRTPSTPPPWEAHAPTPSPPYGNGPAVLRTRGMRTWGGESASAMPAASTPAAPLAPRVPDPVVPAVLRGRATRAAIDDRVMGEPESSPRAPAVEPHVDAFWADVSAKSTPVPPSYRVEDSVAASRLDDADMPAEFSDDFPAITADDRRFSDFAPLRASRDEADATTSAEPVLRRYSDIFVAQEHAPEQLDEPELRLDEDAAAAFAGERRFDDAPAAAPAFVGERRFDDAPAAAPAFLGDARRRRRSFRLWSLACLLGLLVLGGQLLWIYRSALTEDVPMLRPLMQAVCGCKVGYVRHIDQIAIMSSSLHPQVGGKVSAAGQPYLLNVVLRNNYGQPQPWPALTLQLTDISNTVIASRVLLPQSYLPADRSGDSFPGSSQISLVIPLTINIESGQVNGYQLEKFFP